MKMTMTNQEAARRLNGLRELEKLSNPIPAVAGYRIVQNMQALSDALSPYGEIQARTVKKYANGGTSIDRETDPEAYAACVRELSEVDALEISVEVSTFPLPLIAESKFPISVFFALDFMIEKEAAKHGG